jgi:hypothetical protein
MKRVLNGQSEVSMLWNPHCLHLILLPETWEVEQDQSVLDTCGCSKRLTASYSTKFLSFLHDPWSTTIRLHQISSDDRVHGASNFRESFDGQVVQDSTGLELNFQIWNMFHLPVQKISNLDKFRLSPWFHSSQNDVNFLRVTCTVDSIRPCSVAGDWSWSHLRSHSVLPAPIRIEGDLIPYKLGGDLIHPTPLQSSQFWYNRINPNRQTRIHWIQLLQLNMLDSVPSLESLSLLKSVVRLFQLHVKMAMEEITKIPATGIHAIFHQIIN